MAQRQNTPNEHTVTDLQGLSLEHLRALVARYPYYHLARVTLLKQLYRQRDSSFSEELRRAALYLPSRETIFQLTEEEKVCPKVPTASPYSGATVAHKAVTRVQSEATPATPAERTETLIDSFLHTLPNENSTRTAASERRTRRVDASVDYIGYMLQEEEEERRRAAVAAAKRSTEEPVTPPTKALVGEQETSTNSLIDNFIQHSGDKRIRLKDVKDSELQKPVLTTEGNTQQGTFTEALARIYIKQGKFEQAIAIIQRLSLKYPKKNRYFADQIRFLEKLIENQRYAKGE